MNNNGNPGGLTPNEMVHYHRLNEQAEAAGYDPETASLPIILLARQLERVGRVRREADRMGLMLTQPDGSKILNPLLPELRLLETAIMRGLTSMLMTPRSRIIAKLVESVQTTIRGTSVVLRVLGLKNRN